MLVNFRVSSSPPLAICIDPMSCSEASRERHVSGSRYIDGDKIQVICALGTTGNKIRIFVMG